MNEQRFIQLVQFEDGNLWMFNETPEGWKPYKQVTQLIEGEIISREEILDGQVS